MYVTLTLRSLQSGSQVKIGAVVGGSISAVVIIAVFAVVIVVTVGCVIKRRKSRVFGGVSYKSIEED